LSNQGFESPRLQFRVGDENFSSTTLRASASLGEANLVEPDAVG
jgi:hypothetical protein